MTPQNTEALDTAGLRAKAEAATAGPWDIVLGNGDDDEYYGEFFKIGPVSMMGDKPDANDEYIAAANPAVILALLDERDSLLNSIDRAERTLTMHGFQDTGKPEWERAEAAFNPDWANYRQGLGDGRAEAAAGAVPEVVGYMSSQAWRKNQLLSKAQFDSALPKNRVDFDVPLYAAAPPAAAPSEPVEPLMWEATTPAYIRFVTDSRYRKFSPAVQKWYRPICQKCATPPAQDAGTGELIPCAYRIGPIELRGVKIEEAGQIEGPALWAVRQSGRCLNKSGEWEYEPMPSSRGDEFLARCRFATPDEAFRAIANSGGTA